MFFYISGLMALILFYGVIFFDSQMPCGNLLGVGDGNQETKG